MKLFFEATQKRHEAEHQARAWAVWHVAALGRSKKMPELRRFVGLKAKPAKPMNADQLNATGRALYVLMGGDPAKYDEAERMAADGRSQ